MFRDSSVPIAAVALALAVAIVSSPRSVPTAVQVAPAVPANASPGIDTPASTAPVTSSTAPPGATPTRPPAGEAASLAAILDLRIAIDRLGIDLPLAPGDLTRDTPGPKYAGSTPEGVALIHPASAPLASGGNTYVYSHARDGMFLALWGVRLGDTVRIVSASAGIELRYTVSRIAARVAPTDTTWLDPAGPERLTLQTSTGPYPEDPRFVVVAIPDRP